MAFVQQSEKTLEEKQKHRTYPRPSLPTFLLVPFRLPRSAPSSTVSDAERHPQTRKSSAHSKVRSPFSPNESEASLLMHRLRRNGRIGFVSAPVRTYALARGWLTGKVLISIMGVRVSLLKCCVVHFPLTVLVDEALYAENLSLWEMDERIDRDALSAAFISSNFHPGRCCIFMRTSNSSLFKGWHCRYPSTENFQRYTTFSKNDKSYHSPLCNMVNLDGEPLECLPLMSLGQNTQVEGHRDAEKRQW